MNRPADSLDRRDIVNGLRRMCGHDSRSVEGCLYCDAADAIESPQPPAAVGVEPVAEVGHDDAFMRLTAEPLPVGTKLYTATPTPAAAGGSCNCKVSVGLASYHEDDCRVMSAAVGVVYQIRLIDGDGSWRDITRHAYDAMLDDEAYERRALSATPTPAAVPVEELASRFGSEYGTRNGAQPYWDFDRDGLLAFAAAITAAVPDAVRGLVGKWREPTPQDECTLYTMGQRSGRNTCADELEAALSAAPESKALPIFCSCGEGFAHSVNEFPWCRARQVASQQDGQP